MRIVPDYYVVLYYFLIRRSDSFITILQQLADFHLYFVSFLDVDECKVASTGKNEASHHPYQEYSWFLYQTILFKLLLSCLPHSSNFQATNNLSLLPSSSTSYKRNTAIKFDAQNMNNNSYCGSQFLTWRAHFRVYVLGCTQQKLQSDKTSIHLAILLFGFFKLINQIRTLWSVIALNFLPYKYCL